MRGPAILERTMSVPTPKGANGKARPWQYHPRSDHHSKVACWGVILDLLQDCPLLREHLSDGKVGFGINHELVDFRNNRKKALDLVVCSPGSGRVKRPADLRSLAKSWHIVLSDDDRERLRALPDLPVVAVGNVLVALEVKACMTEFAKAGPRLHDELNSSHLIVHAASNEAIAVGLVILNLARRFKSPSRNPGADDATVWNSHKQPRDAGLVIRKLVDLPRRPNTSEVGYDAFGVIGIDCENDGAAPVRLVAEQPSPQPGDLLHYDTMIHRISGLYASRFANR